MIVNLPKKEAKTLDYGSVIVGQHSSYLVVESMYPEDGMGVTLIDLKSNTVWDEFTDLDSVMYEFSQVDYEIYNSHEIALEVIKNG